MDTEAKSTPVAVFDAAWTGHIPVYHREICHAFLKLGHPVYSVAPDVREKSGGTDTADPSSDPFLRRWDTAGTGQNATAVWNSVREHLEAIAGRHARPPLAYFPFVDFGFLREGLNDATFDQVMPFVWGGLLLSPTAGLNGFGIKERSFERLLRAENCAGIHMLTEDRIDAYRAALPGKVVQAMPDFSDNTIVDSQRRFHGLTEIRDDRPRFVFAGNICVRKGFDWFVEAAHRAAQKQRPWSFLAIGSLAMSSVRSSSEYRRILRLLERKPGVSLTPFRVPESDLNAVIKEATAVWCMYRSFPWSSNVLSKAAAFGVPVLTADRGVMASRVAQYGLGQAVSEGKARAIDSALARFADPEWMADWRRSQACRDFARRHSTQGLSESLAVWLDAALARQRRLAS